jgi:hypothetical protein
MLVFCNQLHSKFTQETFMCNGVNFDAAGCCCSSEINNIHGYEDVSENGIV